MLLFLALTAGAHAADTPYWAYSYQGIDVVAAGGGEYARTLAHNVHRLDAAARKLLDWDAGAALPPTHVYVLHHPAFAKLTPPSQVFAKYNTVETITATSRFRDGENFILMDASLQSQYFASYGAYSGLASSILQSELLHYPSWFSSGYARLIAPARIKGTKVTLGKADEQLALFLRTRVLNFAPARALMTLDRSDPAFQGDLMDIRYSAECWLLVHLITIEGLHKKEFADYLRLLNAGIAPADAFAATLQASSEDLDKAMHDVISEGTIRTLTFDIPDVPDDTLPRELSAAEADARIAQLAELAKTQ